MRTTRRKSCCKRFHHDISAFADVICSNQNQFECLNYNMLVIFVYSLSCWKHLGHTLTFLFFFFKACNSLCFKQYIASHTEYIFTCLKSHVIHYSKAKNILIHIYKFYRHTYVNNLVLDEGCWSILHHAGLCKLAK